MYTSSRQVIDELTGQNWEDGVFGGGRVEEGEGLIPPARDLSSLLGQNADDEIVHSGDGRPI